MRLWLWGLAAAFANLTGGAAAQSSEQHPLKAGADFCFSRTYDQKHLAAHPRQIVRALAVMGRNAWLAEPVSGGGVYATMVARFRDTPRPLVMHGKCFFEPNEVKPPGLQCKFFHHALPDILSQEPSMTWPDPDTMHFAAGGDWKAIRARKEPPPDGYGTITTDDKTFLLKRRAAKTCPFPTGLWTSKGPSKTFMGFLP